MSTWSQAVVVAALVAAGAGCSDEAATTAGATATGSGGAGGAATSTGAGGTAGGSVAGVVPVRFHVVSASVEALDAASVIDQAGIETYVAAMNDTFAVADFAVQLESVRTQPALDEAGYQAAVQANETGAGPLVSNVDATQLLAPDGWDVFVVRRTAPLGFGGAYRCTLDPGMPSDMPVLPGAVFIPVQAGNGQPQETRKWTHELGHALGLPHPPCMASHADNLMTSGNCDLAEADRTALTVTQIERMNAQIVIGGPVACGATDPNTY